MHFKDAPISWKAHKDPLEVIHLSLDSLGFQGIVFITVCDVTVWLEHMFSMTNRRVLEGNWSEVIVPRSQLVQSGLLWTPPGGQVPLIPFNKSASLSE